MRFILIFLIAFFTSVYNPLSAQKYRNGITEFGIFLGGGNYFGDLAPEIVLNETKPAFGIYQKTHHTKYFSSRYQLLYTQISGDDKNFKSNAYRNIKFKSDIVEMSYISEFNFKPYGINVKEGKSTFFVFGGISLFYFNPQRKINDKDFLDLRDFGTEGQNINRKRKYPLIQPAIILGIGQKMNLGRKWVLGLEIGFRKTFTDYLDDTKNVYVDYATINRMQGNSAGYLSHPETLNNNQPIQAGTMRGDAHLKDWFFTFGITLSKRKVELQPCSSSL